MCRGGVIGGPNTGISEKILPNIGLSEQKIANIGLSEQKIANIGISEIILKNREIVTLQFCLSFVNTCVIV